MSSIQRSDRCAFFARSVIENYRAPVRSHDNGHTENHVLRTVIIERQRNGQAAPVKITAEDIGQDNLLRLGLWIQSVESGNAPHGKRAYVLAPTDLAALTPGTRRIAMSGNAVVPLRTQKWHAEMARRTNAAAYAVAAA